MAALSIPFFYFFFKEFLNRRTALTACFFLAVSEYLINFSKIGYVSLQSLFALSVSMAAATWAVRSGKMAAFAAAGAALAMNFYFFGVALVGIPLAGLLVLWFVPPLTRLAWRRWGVLTAGFGVLFFPLLLQPAYWETGFRFTVFGGFEGGSPSDSLLQIIFNRVVTAWFSYLYSPNESHFVAVSFVDWGTAILIGIGFFAILFKFGAAVLPSSFSSGGEFFSQLRQFLDRPLCHPQPECSLFFLGGRPPQPSVWSGFWTGFQWVCIGDRTWGDS